MLVGDLERRLPCLNSGKKTLLKKEAQPVLPWADIMVTIPYKYPESLWLDQFWTDWELKRISKISFELSTLKLTYPESHLF